MDKDITIISVESRKGGVGKTTVVLNLAKLLKERYHILVLDVDVTGTSINAIQDTSIWEESVKLLQFGDGTTINLLQFFKDRYLLGNYNIGFIANAAAENMITVYSDVINVMGSELYGKDGKMLYDPAIIFDEIHDYWLLDMIGLISQSFSDSFNDGKKSLIILDNSPGYVGLGKSIHDLLTDMGPERGKFLSVSSLDSQDIDSCLKAINNIHSLVKSKEKGADFFNHAEERDLATLKEGTIEQNTFDRLAIGDATIQYYLEKERMGAELPKYQALVFNKVPANVKNGLFLYKYQGKDDDLLSDTLVSLCGEDISQSMIAYDPSIHYQFFRRNISLSIPVDNDKYEHLHKQLESLRRRAGNQESYFNRGEWRRIAFSMNTLNRDMGRLPDSINEVGLFELSSHINPAWYPESVFRTMFRHMQSMGLVSIHREFYFPYFLPKKFIFEGLLDLEFLASFPRVSCAVMAIFVVLESFLKQNEKGLPIASSLVTDILKRCLNDDGVLQEQEHISEHLMAYVAHLRKDAHHAEQLFQLSFLEALARVLDITEDIILYCDSILLFLTANDGNSVSTDTNVAWILDAKIVSKHLQFEKAEIMMRETIAEFDYMRIVRQALIPIIARWGL